MPSSGGSPISLREYARRVHDLRQIVDHVTAAHTHILHVAARKMDALGRVHITNGPNITTPLPEWGRSLMSGRPFEIRSIRRQLDALDSALQALRPRQRPSGQLSQLDTVLRDPRFHPTLNPVQAAEAWIGDTVTRFLWFLAHHLSVSGTNGYPILNAIVAAVFLLLVAGIALLLARAAIRRNTASIPARGAPSELVSPSVARERAAGMASAGSYREAFRYLFLATLLELREAGLIQLRPGDTNREYVFSLGATAETVPQREALAALVDEFDRVWYGHQPLTRPEYERWAALAASILEPAMVGQTA